MTVHDYSQLNTAISVKEQSFLSRANLVQLLNAVDDEQLALYLEGTPYSVPLAEIRQHDVLDQTIMKALAADYDFAYQQCPDPNLVNVFGLKYVYHNLKLFLKMRAIGRDLSHLLIPIGPYPLEALKHLSLTLESDLCDPLIVEEVAQTWSEYKDYENTVAIDMGMDSAYFRHLRVIADQSDFPLLQELVDAKIDFFNAITALRALAQDKPNSFAYQLMSRKGTKRPKEMLHLAKDGQLASWFNAFNALPYTKVFDSYVQAMQSGKIQASQMEQLQDLYLTHLVNSASLDALSGGQILRYLNGCEMEAVNLRLILLGRANGIAKEAIEERMRLGYHDN